MRLMLVLLLMAGSYAQAGDANMRELFAPYQTLLEQHLEERPLPHDGLVTAFDYAAAAAAAETRPLLTEQRRRLAEFDPQSLATRDAALSFWLNAYNYFMIDYILDHPQRGQIVGSVRDFGNLFNPYRVFRQSAFDVGGRKYSLDEMEKGILLGEGYKARGWKDARVHFAVNCASVGCPPLRQTIYLPSAVDAVLTDNTRRALNTERHLRVDGNTLHLTRLFDWYEADYVEAAGSVRDFILAYADERVRRQVERSERIAFVEYDWSLNSPENFPEFR
ncbi:MAG: DUF547 domain-containing protein [Pseudomonadales bacterium]